MMDAEQINREMPAMAGDIIVEDDGTRYLVRYAEMKSKTVSASCGCCSKQEWEYIVYIDEPWNGPEVVICSGGGCCLVMPIVRWHGTWPPENATVYRDGHPLFPPVGDTCPPVAGSSDSDREGDSP